MQSQEGKTTGVGSSEREGGERERERDHLTSTAQDVTGCHHVCSAYSVVQQILAQHRQTSRMKSRELSLILLGHTYKMTKHSALAA